MNPKPKVLIFYFRFIYCMFMTYMSAIHYMCACCLQRSEDGVGFPGTGTVDGCELQCGCQT